MTSVIIFILGALFSLALVMAILMTLSATMVPAGQNTPTPAAAPRREPRHFAKAPPHRPASARPADTRAADPRAADPRKAIPARNSAADREAYRIAKSLEQAERALTKIANGREAAAAKIAQQTVRRLKDAKEPPKARLVFALARLELLSLRPEPYARAEASAALCAFI